MSVGVGVCGSVDLCVDVSSVMCGVVLVLASVSVQVFLVSAQCYALHATHTDTANRYRHTQHRQTHRARTHTHSTFQCNFPKVTCVTLFFLSQRNKTRSNETMCKSGESSEKSRALPGKAANFKFVSVPSKKDSQIDLCSDQ